MGPDTIPATTNEPKINFKTNYNNKAEAHHTKNVYKYKLRIKQLLLKQVSNAMISYSSFGGFCFRLTYIFYRDVFLHFFPSRRCLMCRRMFKYSGALLPPFLDRRLCHIYECTQRASNESIEIKLRSLSAIQSFTQNPNTFDAFPYLIISAHSTTTRHEGEKMEIMHSGSIMQASIYGAVHNHNERKFKRSGMLGESGCAS